MSKNVNTIAVRLTLAAAGAFGGIIVSPWAAALAIVLLALLWPSWEAIVLGLCMDLFWLPPGHVPYFTLGAIAVVWLFQPIRKEFLP